MLNLFCESLWFWWYQINTVFILLLKKKNCLASQFSETNDFYIFFLLIDLCGGKFFVGRAVVFICTISVVCTLDFLIIISFWEVRQPPRRTDVIPLLITDYMGTQKLSTLCLCETVLNLILCISVHEFSVLKLFVKKLYATL